MHTDLKHLLSEASDALSACATIGDLVGQASALVAVERACEVGDRLAVRAAVHAMLDAFGWRVGRRPLLRMTA